MAHINFVNSFENTSHFNEDALFLIATFITNDAEALGAEGIPDNLYVTCCDIDRIYLSTNLEASPESPPDYVIRMWNYHIGEEDCRRVHMNSTFHIMQECPDGSGKCSAEQFDGDYDILVYGEIAKMRIAVLKGLTEIHIPDNVTVIPKDAFSCCPNLKEVHIPEGVTTIEPCAFESCKSLSRIDLPNSLTTIGFYALWGCSSLQKIHIPDNVIEIGSNAFALCDSLTEISIPILNISEIGLREETHISLRADEGVRHIPDGIRSIPPEAFKNCSDIKSVQIPNSVTHIGWKAFYGCSGIKEIHIPDSVFSIGKEAFKDCDNLNEISIPIGLDISFAGLSANVKINVRNNDGVRVIPKGVPEIGDRAFKDCTGLKVIHLPDSLTRIGNDAFDGCSGLTEIHIPDSVTSIGNYAFLGCTGLTEINIPDSVTEIGRHAFWRCTSLSKLTVSPDNPVYDSRDNCNAIIETDTGILIADCRNTVFTDSWLKTLSERYGLDDDESDEEIRALTILKKIYQDDEDSELCECVRKYISSKFRHEWYKNYIGTKKLSFDGPTNYTEEGIISDEDISNMMCGNWDDFLRYRLKVGHTERQDRFTSFMRDYPMEILDWLGEDTIPYYFYEGLSKGGDYELYGCSKEEFIDILSNKYEVQFGEEDVEYAAVLEEKYGIDYAVGYLKAINWYLYFFDLTDGSADFIVQKFSKAVSLGDNAEALKSMGYLSINRDDGKLCLDFSIEMYSRLAVMWKKGLIDDDWLTDEDCYGGLAYVFDWEWGFCWEEGDYPENPDEDSYRLWLIKLLESDFADDIADYLKPLLEQVLERERNHNWETGKKTIESFLAKTSNK